ncbi:MAG: FUSC family protein [Acetobacteraceae bacterium]
MKTFAAAVIAFYIALAMQLDHPYWAMTTVYMVSQPLSGAMRSKGTYRFCGTFLGRGGSHRAGAQPGQRARYC